MEIDQNQNFLSHEEIKELNPNNSTLINNNSIVPNAKPKMSSKQKTPEPDYLDSDKIQIAWRSAVMITSIHIMGLCGTFLLFTGRIYFWTFANALAFGMMSGLGTTAGAHRYWAHKSYKAKLPLQILLAYFQTVACQNSIYEWVRDHRVHHKYTETDADPHNAKRGFFFAHCGWLMCRKHQDVTTKGKSVDMSDLASDPVVAFQKKYYLTLIAIFSFIIPTLIPFYFGENLVYSWLMTMFRYMLSLNFTWLVNSAAHLWGPRPYDININPAENLWVSVLAGGEGWHNYHHVFPWDYKASELGMYRFNMTALFIDLCAKIGWAYGLKTVPKKVVEMRMTRTGDSSHYRH